MPEGAQPVDSDESGYIQNIYPEGLNEVAARYEVTLYLPKLIGDFVFLHEPLVWVVGEVDDDDREEFASLLRSYDQDPRFGLTVMGEIASKALSPGINDPGTAIDVITRVGRILSSYTDENVSAQDAQDGPQLGRLWVPPLDPANLLDDGFGALSRDGAQLYEVQHRLQATLAGLMRHPDAGLRDAARDFAEIALRRALAQMDFEPDRARLLSAVDDRLRQRMTEA